MKVDELLDAAASATGLDNPSLAFNLLGGADWSTANPFLNLAKSMRSWFGFDENWNDLGYDDLKANGHVDEHGWIQSIPDDMRGVRTIWSDTDEKDDGREGVYVMQWTGEGELKLGGDARILSQSEHEIVFENTEGRTFWLDITEIEQGDHIRDLSIVRQDHVALHEAGALFNPDWLEHVEDARQLRFLNWMRANDANAGLDESLSDVNDASWVQAGGVPIEVMVRLANEVGADPWFTIPHGASDAYIRQFAEYVRDHLDPALRAHVEYSNEAWNGNFPQFHWLEEQARQQWGVSQGGVFDYYAKKATETALIWQDVFGDDGESRLVNVLGGQTGNTDIISRILSAGGWKANEPGAFVSPREVFDAIAVTTYFGSEEIVSGAARRALIDAIADPDIDAEAWLAARLRDGANGFSIPHVAKLLAQHAALAKEEGLDLLAYEGGQHVHHIFGISELTPAEIELLTPFLAEFVRSEYMAELYEELWDVWREVGDGPFMQFGDVAAASKWGSWGLISHLYDSTPRSVFLTQQNEDIAAWWEDRGGAHFQQGVILKGDAGADTLTGTFQEDYLLGGDGDDVLTGGKGNDGLHGGAGVDIAVLSGVRSDYNVSMERDGVYIVKGPDDVDRLVDVEKLAFSDGSVLRIAEDPLNPPPNPGGGNPDLSKAVILRGEGALVDADGKTAAVDPDGDAGMKLVALNRWSALGREIADGGSGPLYAVAPKGVTASFDGVTYTLNYWTWQENLSGPNGDRLASDALSAAIEFGHVVQGASGMIGGKGNDQLVGGLRADHFHGGAGNDWLRGSDGDDVLEGGADNDLIDGGAGDDTAVFSGDGGGVVLYTDQSYRVIAGPDGVDYLSGIETISFRDGETFATDDLFHVVDETGLQIMTALRGDLVMAEGGNAVTSLCSAGVRVEAVNRWSQLGRELATLSEESGGEYLIVERGATASFNGQTVSQSYWSLQENRASQKAPQPLADRAVDAALEFGSVTVDARAVAGTRHADFFEGRQASDHFIGMGGDDRINSGGGDDILDGGTGDDVLNGGAGADIFMFRRGDGVDVVRNFSREDRLDLGDTGLNAGALATAAQTVASGLLISYEGGSILLEGLDASDLSWILLN